MEKVHQERRRSERLKEDIAMTTQEKVEIIAKKRNLEGNLPTTNAFSALPIEEIVNTVSDMGISVNHDDFATFDLLQTLEVARDDLYLKQCEKNQASQTESVEIPENSAAPLQLEWMHEESSEPEDIILVESRKKREKKGKLLSSLQLIILS